MNLVLKVEIEKLIKSQLNSGKYETAEEVMWEALRLLEERNRREAISQKVKDLFDRTQALPGVADITEEEIAAEIEAYRRGE
ncbi:MAG: type II toxin-antitoxin system ParD family antitoxin [Cyanobacteriota bacterium]|jgi:antitoxin ParD1/3/4|nr:type II toxin-antitoxin system ParD family antitoxin [Cyanobacteriota bacterium]